MYKEFFRKFDQSPPPWVDAVSRDGIMPPIVARGILNSLEDRAGDSEYRRSSLWERRTLYKYNHNLLHFDVINQFPHDLIKRPSWDAERVYKGLSWVGDDVEISKSTEIMPNISKPSSVKVLLKSGCLPNFLDDPRWQREGWSSLVQLSTRSRYAQVGIEFSGCDINSDQYKRIKQGESIEVDAFAYNYGKRPYSFGKGDHPFSYFSFDGLEKLTGFELTGKEDDRSIIIDGKVNEDWEWIFHPFLPRNYLNIVGARLRVDKWQTLKDSKEDEKPFRIQDGGSGYRDEIAKLLEPVDFNNLLPGVNIQKGPFASIEEYKKYLKLLENRDVNESLKSVFLIAETPKMILKNGVSAVVGSFPNAYAYQLNATKIEGTRNGELRTSWPVRTEIVVPVFGNQCLLPSFINFYFFTE